MSDKVPDSEFTVTIESFKDRENRLFDCVNASAVDFIWKKSEFESILTIATPNLLQLCESELLLVFLLRSIYYTYRSIYSYTYFMSLKDSQGRSSLSTV